MIYQYKGNYAYNKLSITQYASDGIGVYYCGSKNADGSLFPLYIGRAKGENVSIKSRLLDHFRDDNWSDVSIFGYRECTTMKEAEDLEAAEIAKFKPKYNTQLKTARYF
jgi:excinuclease UvrABC nuclease subunit